MLEIRPSCEHCNKALPNTSDEAMICSYECTYCRECAKDLFKNVCPSCGGNFEKRPIRPKAEIINNPASTNVIHKHKDLNAAGRMIDRYSKTLPKDR